ncbi:2-acylglycerol O-acyltransferase 2-like [Haemaphysalis longicornis]
MSSALMSGMVTTSHRFVVTLWTSLSYGPVFTKPAIFMRGAKNFFAVYSDPIVRLHQTSHTTTASTETVAFEEQVMLRHRKTRKTTVRVTSRTSICDDDEAGGWRYVRDYFPVQLVKTCDLPADRNYLFGCHPHGVMAAGAVCNFATDATNFRHLFPGIRTHLATVQIQFSMPFYRELLLACGVCCPSRESLDCVLSSKTPGRAAAILVGGDTEMHQAQPGSYKLVLTKRKGFVRVALKHGTPLVPVFSFGENEIFVQAEVPVDSLLGRVVAWIKSLLGFTPPLFWGRGVFQYSWGWVPHRKRIVTVVGKPLEVPKLEFPSDEEVDRVHRQYIDALTQLFNDHKDKYATAGSKLVII